MNNTEFNRMGGYVNETVNLNRFASVMATDHSADTSSKFAFIPTTRVVDILERQNWVPSSVQEKRALKDSTRGFQTHLIRFRQPDNMQIARVVGDLIPEIVLKNAHDGTAAFVLMAGIFRLVCSNGMIVADSMFASHKIRHIGFQDQNVIDAVFSVTEGTPKIMGRVNEFKQIELDKPEMLAMGEAALIAKYGQGEEDVPVAQRYDIERLVRPTRPQDRISQDYNAPRNTLWNTYNVIQEKLIEKGGRFARKEYEPAQGYTSGGFRTVKARGVKSVSENVRINQALWMLTEKMAILKGAGTVTAN
jgi:hypothetical protein